MQKIVMIGSSCIDEYYDMDYVPKLGEKAITPFIENKIGGMIGNAAAVAASYGMDVYVMDTVNKSNNTMLVLEDCRRSGIKLDLIRYDESLPDVKCMIMLKDGERIVYVVPSKKHDLIPDSEERRVLREADYVYTSIEELKRFKDTMGFINELKEAETRLVLDVEYINDAEKELEWKIIKSADIIFVNEEGDDHLKEKINERYKEELKGNGCLVVQTKGDKGCEICSLSGDMYKIPAYPVVPVDTTGAGDTFNASFVYALSQGLSEPEAGKFANGAAAHSILGMGARSGAVGEEVVKKFIKDWRGKNE